MIVLTFVPGIGIPLYLAGWLLMPTADGGPAAAARLWARPGAWQIGAGVACLTLAALLTVRELGLWWSDAIVWPFVLASSGLAILWRQTAGRSRAEAVERERAKPRAPMVPAEPDDHGRGDADRDGARRRRVRGRRAGERRPSRAPARASTRAASRWRSWSARRCIFLQANGALSGARDLVLSLVVVALGLGLILAPFWLQLARNLTAERSARIRSQERAEVAAHLHDSVLQTLALVQKRADDPRAVATLARRQERELRAWLSGAPEARPDECLADALRAAAAECEEAHGVPVEVVTVGDRDLDDRHRALVAAAREALANAARHSGATEITLFMEVEDGRTEVFVRDRGAGFDAGAVPGDRRGVRESIVGRMARHGGSAAVHTTPGSGTEVELVIADG